MRSNVVRSMQFLVNVKEKSNVLFARGQPDRKAGQPAGGRSLAPCQREGAPSPSLSCTLGAPSGRNPVQLGNPWL